MGLAHNALLYIGFENSKRLLMPLYREVECMQHALGRKVIGHNALGDVHGFDRHAERLRIEAKVNNQFFGGAGNATKIGV